LACSKIFSLLGQNPQKIAPFQGTEFLKKILGRGNAPSSNPTLNGEGNKASMKHGEGKCQA